jgi:hypothetical protein
MNNDAGLILSAVPFTDGIYSVSSNGRGTLSLINSNLKHYYDAVFYLTGPNTPFLLEAHHLPRYSNPIRTDPDEPVWASLGRGCVPSAINSPGSGEAVIAWQPLHFVPGQRWPPIHFSGSSRRNVLPDTQGRLVALLMDS